MTPEPRDAGRGIRDQIERYRTAFIAVVMMIAAAVLIGGYILSHERLSLPGWFPFVGTSNFVLKADFQTAQAVTPGQGQAVTIAGAKVGEVASVQVHEGLAEVTMDLQPRYARYIYNNATLLLRPKTQLKDMTVQIDIGSPSAGRVREGHTFGLGQTAPDVNLEQFLDSLDVETRTYLQELLAGAGGALKHNGRALSSVFRRFDPTARDIAQITSELQHRSVYIERSIHNFQLLMSSLGDSDKQIAEAVQSGNKVLGAFAKQDRAVQQTVSLLPGALKETKKGLRSLTGAANAIGPALHSLHGFAASLAPALEASRQLFHETAPIVGEQVTPFTEEVQPVLRRVTPATKSFDEALPKLTTSFSVLNEFFNELAYNPGGKQQGFLFFVEWASHDFNSALSTAEANGPTGRTLLYLNCELAKILNGVAGVNPDAHLLIGLLKPPEAQECAEHGLGSTAAASSAATSASARSGKEGR